MTISRCSRCSYWPVPPEHPDLSPQARDHVREYLRTGGMILFDTRDAGVLLPGQPGGGPGERRLGELLAGIDCRRWCRCPRITC